MSHIVALRSSVPSVGRPFQSALPPSGASQADRNKRPPCRTPRDAYIWSQGGLLDNQI